MLLFCLSTTVYLFILMPLLKRLFTIQPPLHLTTLNYLSSSLQLLRHKLLPKRSPFSSPSPTAAHCLNVTSLAIWSALLSRPVRNNQAFKYESIAQKNRQRVCFISVHFSLDIF